MWWLEIIGRFRGGREGRIFPHDQEPEVRRRETGLWRLAERLYYRFGLTRRLAWVSASWTLPHFGAQAHRVFDALDKRVRTQDFCNASLLRGVLHPRSDRPRRSAILVTFFGTESTIFVRSFGQDLYVGFHSFIRIMPGLVPLVIATALAVTDLVFRLARKGDILPGLNYPNPVVVAIGGLLVVVAEFVIILVVLGGVALWIRRWFSPDWVDGDDQQMVINTLSSLVEEEISALFEETTGTERGQFQRLIRRDWHRSTGSSLSLPWEWNRPRNVEMDGPGLSDS